MKFGAEPKKLGMLGGLTLVLGYFLYTNVISPGADVPERARRAAAPQTAPQRPDPADRAFPAPAAAETRSRPPLRPGAPSQIRFTTAKDKKIDPTTIDPTLRLDLLAKVQSVNMEGGDRNLFQFGAAPMPKAPEPKVIPKPAAAKPGEDNKPPEPPPKPPPPPIPLKFYGYTAVQAGQKRAFFLDGDDIVVAPEGTMIKGRYKVVRIGVNSVVVEDTQFKHQQTLPLEEQAG